MDAWAQQHDVELAFTRLDRPTGTSFIESFNERLRDEWLNVELFGSIEDAPRTLQAWRHDYNHLRRHSSIGDEAPAAFVAKTLEGTVPSSREERPIGEAGLLECSNRER